MEMIIFDLDGTLLDTLEDLYICFNYAISRYGYPIREKNEIRKFVGNGIRKAIERALPYAVEENELNDIVNVFKEYYLEHMHTHTKPYNGIIEMLTIIKQMGYKVGVVSNKYDAAVKELCRIYFGELIDVAVGEGNGIRKKPEADGIMKAVSEANVKIREVLYVGDSEVDIQTAKKAEVPCISVLWGFKDKDFLKEHGAKIFAEVPKDIIKIIEKKIYLE